MRALLCRWRRVWCDWRTNTRECYGGPFDGRRVSLDITPRRAFWFRIDGLMFTSKTPTFCEGEYTLQGRRFVWQQWVRVAPVEEL